MLDKKFNTATCNFQIKYGIPPYFILISGILFLLN